MLIYTVAEGPCQNYCVRDIVNIELDFKETSGALIRLVIKSETNIQLAWPLGRGTV